MIVNGQQEHYVVRLYVAVRAAFGFSARASLNQLFARGSVPVSAVVARK